MKKHLLFFVIASMSIYAFGQKTIENPQIPGFWQLDLDVNNCNLHKSDSLNASFYFDHNNNIRALNSLDVFGFWSLVDSANLLSFYFEKHGTNLAFQLIYAGDSICGEYLEIENHSVSCEIASKIATSKANQNEYTLTLIGLEFNYSYDSIVESVAKQLLGTKAEVRNLGCVIKENDRCFNTTMEDEIKARFGSHIHESIFIKADSIFSEFIQSKIDSGYVFSMFDIDNKAKPKIYDQVNRKLVTASFTDTRTIKVVIDKNGSPADLILRSDEQEYWKEIMTIARQGKWDAGQLKEQRVKSWAIIVVEFVE